MGEEMLKLITKTSLTFFIFVTSIYSYAQEQSTSTSKTSILEEMLSKEKWGIGYSNYTNGPALSGAPSEGSINHYISIKRKFSPDWSASAVLRPDTTLNGSSTLSMGDHYVKLDPPAFYKNGEKLSIAGDVRYYFPTSEKSKKNELAGILTTRLTINASIDRISLFYILIPNFYMNKKIADEQSLFSHGHYIGGSYKFSDKVTGDFAIYPAWTLRRNANALFNDLPAYPGMTYTFNKQLSVSPYLEIPLQKISTETSSMGAFVSYTVL